MPDSHPSVAQLTAGPHDLTGPQAFAEAPFVVEHRQEDRTLSGNFRPASRLILTPALRTDGLWAALPPEDFKNLILMLTFLTPNGWCRPTLIELSEAMRVSQAKAKSRMERLMEVEWRGQPLVSELPRPDGLEAYVPGRALVAHEDVPTPGSSQTPSVPTAGREAILAHSRARYAKTRAEVEAQIGEMMGWAPPDFAGEDSAVAEGKRQMFKAMTDVGMPKEQALDLLARFDPGAVERQIAWLPQRRAKNPARFLAAAIEGDYDMPPGLRRRAFLEGTLRGQNERGQAQGEEKATEYGATPAQTVAVDTAFPADKA